MKISSRIKLVVIILVLFITCIPLAFIITVISSPIWLWIEKTFSIESVGHSGPAEWCYLTVYLFLISASGLIWLKIGKRKTTKR